MLEQTRAAFAGRTADNQPIRSVLLQAPTGAGKTIIFSKITELARNLGTVPTWIIVPRNELLQQASDSLANIGVAHGLIAAGVQESKAFDIHVVSKDTLIRRLDKIKVPPKFVIVDEAHLALARYLQFFEFFCDTKFLGVTATPERLDGRGLSEMYERLVLGPTIHELISLGFLTDVVYFCPPIQGIENLHRRGTEYDPDELERLLETRKVYGKTIDHYKRHAWGKPALVFCRSIKAADETAQKFNAAGFLFENIDGTMSYKRRKALIGALRTGEIHGLTSCELITYGLDVPRVECIIMLRPTLSRTLFLQMIGRGLRPFEGKQRCVVLDHVGNLQVHGHPLAPYEWNFHGREKPKRKRDSEDVLRLCPEIDFMYCDKRTCIGCPHNHSGKTIRNFEFVNAELIEAESPIKLNDRPPEEKREFIDRINHAKTCWHAGDPSIKKGAIGDMLAIANELGRDPMWVYWKLAKDRLTVQVSILHEIARQRGYKPGWAWFKKKMIKERLENG